MIALPPLPWAAAAYFRRRQSAIAELSKADIASNERLWAEESRGVPLAETPILSRDEAARLDDPFKDCRFGPVGQFTACRGCGLTFESRGLKLCPDCYPALGDPVERKSQAPPPARFES
jgi:hypothetical protein